MNNFSGKIQQEVEVKASHQYLNERQQKLNESTSQTSRIQQDMQQQATANSSQTPLLAYRGLQKL